MKIPEISITTTPCSPADIQRQLLWQISASQMLRWEDMLSGSYTPEQRQRIVVMIKWGSQSTTRSQHLWLDTVNQWQLWGLPYDEILYNLIQQIGYPPTEELKTAEPDEEGVYFK
jgi:hypothetical protein